MDAVVFPGGSTQVEVSLFSQTDRTSLGPPLLVGVIGEGVCGRLLRAPRAEADGLE